MTNGNAADNGIFAPEHPLPFLLYAAALGIALAFFIDFFSLSEKLFGKNKVILFFTDFLSVTAAYLLLFAGALYYNDGIIRWYHAASAVFGNRLYAKTLSHSVKTVLDKLYSAAEKTIERVFAILAFPVRFVSGAAIRLYRRIVGFQGVVTADIVYKSEREKFKNSAEQGFGMDTALTANKNKKRKKRKRNGK